MKGIGIFLVVFGHIYSEPDATQWIYSFHMPLFFFISGYLFKRNDLSVKKSILKISRSILFSYLIFYILTYIYWLIIERHFRVSDVEWWRPIIGLFYGTNTNSYMAHNIVLWFLPALYSVEVIFIIIYKFLKAQSLYVAIAEGVVVVLGIILINNKITYLPWGGATAFIASGFYTFGYFIKKMFPIIRMRYIILILILSLCMWLFLPTSIIPIDMNSCVYGNWGVFILYAVVGIMFVFAFSSLVNRNKIIQMGGESSLVIMCVHGPIYRVILGIASRITHQDIFILRESLLISVVVTILSIICIIPVAYLYNHYISNRLRKL